MLGRKVKQASGMKSFLGVGRVVGGIVLVDSIAREGLTEKVNADQTPEGGERVHRLGKNFPGRGKSKCKGPEAGSLRKPFR